MLLGSLVREHLKLFGTINYAGFWPLESNGVTHWVLAFSNWRKLKRVEGKGRVYGLYYADIY